ncbi:MAG: hypothetical protein ACE5HU_00250 [Acidobacteriota bacterium]
MKIISVAAPGNSSGKTSTIAAILGAFPGRLDAVKFTTVFKDGVNCPRTETACACRTLRGPFTVVTERRMLQEEGTDTGRLARAGARSVLWCLARQGWHRQAWSHLRAGLVGETAEIITEGNSIVPFLDPDMLIMVVDPALARERWKPDSWELIERADRVVINDHGCRDEAIAILSGEVSRHRAGERPAIEEVSRPLAGWRDRWLRETLAQLLDDGVKPVP